jgi:hypothetical protein
MVEWKDIDYCLSRGQGRGNPMTFMKRELSRIIAWKVE